MSDSNNFQSFFFAIFSYFDFHIGQSFIELIIFFLLLILSKLILEPALLLSLVFHLRLSLLIFLSFALGMPLEISRPTHLCCIPVHALPSPKIILLKPTQGLFG